MIRTLKVYCSETYDPYFNLATEQYLLESTEPGCCTLYLWQNQNTVVIGRNQNPWKECRTAMLEANGGHLARRLSGGGAVFHDLGNLNFTFLLPVDDYDLDRQLSVIQHACEKLGLYVERSGRNDILCEGRKFSGNAFYKHNGLAYHHGTLMVNADLASLGQYLSPSKAKLAAKGVDSVRSRVANLSEFSPDITIESLKEALIHSFQANYGCPLLMLNKSELDLERIHALEAHYGSFQWLYGRRIPFSVSMEGRFSWGEIGIDLQVDEGMILDCRVYSDSMEWDVFPTLEQRLKGHPFSVKAMMPIIMDACPAFGEDICQLLDEQQL